MNLNRNRFRAGANTFLSHTTDVKIEKKQQAKDYFDEDEGDDNVQVAQNVVGTNEEDDPLESFM